MALTFPEVCEELKKLDEQSLLELLEITSDEIVNKFEDKIEDNLEHLTLLIDDNKEEGLYEYDN